jgi:hypothetical protein
MKRILPIVMITMLGAWTAAAQTSASAQAGASAESHNSVQAGKSGAQASGSGSASTSASANAGKGSAKVSNPSSRASIASGTKIYATLAKSLDAKKNKPGDRVEARATQDVKQNGKVVLKKGTRLVGHVTQSQSRTSGKSQSELGIVFDHAILKGGQEVPFHATIQALAVAQSSAAALADSDGMMASGGVMGGSSAMASGGGGLVGGVASTAGATAGSVVNTAGSMPVNAGGLAGGTLNAATRSTGAVGGLTTTGYLASNSSGVFGLQGLSINSAASSATQGSMIVSSSKNVHLASGTQMLLSAGGQAK